MEDIVGNLTDYISDAELRNAPNVTPLSRPSLALPGIVFTLVDKKASALAHHANPCPDLARL
jgi:hypothetical protein